MVLACAIVLLLAFLGNPASGHHPGDRVDEQLLDAGSRIMYGGFDAGQTGPLVVVPHHEGPLPCTVPERSPYLLPLGDSAGVTFLTNGSHLVAVMDLPVGHDGYAALAMDTGRAVRTLIMMQEHAMSLHRFGAVIPSMDPGGNDSARWGLMGVPYELPEPSPHDIDHPMPGDGIQLDHDDNPRGAAFCRDDESGHVGFVFPHEGSGEPIGPGRLVHVVALYDEEVAAWLPRPVDESTAIEQWNLYLSRAGEDPEQLRAALSSRIGVDDAVPLLLFALAFVWAVVGRR